jgi:hypothetical protein
VFWRVRWWWWSSSSSSAAAAACHQQAGMWRIHPCWTYLIMPSFCRSPAIYKSSSLPLLARCCFLSLAGMITSQGCYY